MIERAVLLVLFGIGLIFVFLKMMWVIYLAFALFVIGLGTFAYIQRPKGVRVEKASNRTVLYSDPDSPVDPRSVVPPVPSDS